jgi:hypothetical protein
MMLLTLHALCLLLRRWQGSTTAASALLDLYVNASVVSGVNLTNGSFVATATAALNGVCVCNATLPNLKGGVGFTGADCSTMCNACGKVSRALGLGDVTWWVC